MKKMKTGSIYYRLLVTFLLIMLPIVALGAAIFQWGRTTIQAQTEQAAAENVSFLKSTLETEISGVKLLQYSLSGDNSLVSLISQQGEIPPYDYYTNVASLQERLNIVKNSNNFIQSVRVYIPAAGRVVSSDSGYRTVGEKELAGLLQTQTGSHFPLIFSSSGITADSVFPPTTSPGKQPLYLCEVVLSDSQLRGFLNKFENYSNSDTALYDYSSREWVFGQKSIPGTAADAGLQELAGSRESRNMRITLNGRDYFAAAAYSKYLNLSIVQYVPVEDVFRTPNVYRRLFILYLLLSAVILFIYSRTTYRFVKYPINVILEAFRRLQKGDMTVRVQAKAASEFNDLYSGFNQTADRLNELIDRVYKQELYAKKAELKQLQAQINPHFLYNSYFMLSRMIREEDMESAGQLCSYLGTYFEYITRNANEEVPLWKEREHALSYAMIQQMRFSERLHVEVGEIPADWSSFSVPRLLLQPLVENALNHGMKSVSGNGLVRMDFAATPSVLSITVEDSGASLSDGDIDAIREKLDHPDDRAETTGMINVSRRVELRYGPGSGLFVSRSGLGGLKAEIRILPEAEPEIKKEP